MSHKPVLVVEDDTEIRDIMRQALELQGYRVVTARNGADALETLKAIESPKAILLDVMMPVLDGWGFLVALERENPAVFEKIPVVVVSAACDVQRPDEVKRQVRILNKPVSLDVLYDTLDRLCEAPAAEAA